MRPGLLVLMAVLAACGDGGAHKPTPPTAEELKARLLKEADRVGAIARRPWVNGIPALKAPLTDIQSRILQLTYPSELPEDFYSRATNLLADYDSRWTSVVQAVEKVDAVAHAVWSVEDRMERLLATLAIPDEQPFPLRTRYRDGWMPDKHQWFRFIVEGLAEHTLGKDPQRYAVGTANLSRVLQEGTALHHRLNMLTRQVRLLDHKLKNLADRVEWARAVTRKARKSSAADPKTLSTIETAATAGEQAHTDLKKRWAALRSPYVGRPDALAKDHRALMREFDRHLAAISRLAGPTAVAVGLLDR